ncbi:spore coat protein GerQ [Amphibacillus sp. Q70]|uniref:spore coat protein GerQ n=1 Tax=Amphibacillus sp. Q70 TaxID=3453416 RepID=UPI003F82B0F1
MSEEKDQRQQMPIQGMYQMPMPSYPMMPMQNFPPPMQPGPFQPEVPSYPQQQPAEPTPADNMLPLEQSYVENILRLNRGKVATVYMTFENNERWNAKIFKGIIEAAGRDHIILSDPETDKRYLLLTIYLDYITFDEKIDYDYPVPTDQAF